MPILISDRTPNRELRYPWWGTVAAVLVLAILEALALYDLPVPKPGSIMLFLVAAHAFNNGLRWGLATAAVGIAAVAVTATEFIRFVPSAVLIPAAAVLAARAREAVLRQLESNRVLNERLAESEQRFRGLAEHAPLGIFLTGGGGEVVFVNAALRQLAGLDPVRGAGEHWQRAVHPEDLPRITQEWSDATREGRPLRSTLRFQRPDGVATTVRVRASPFAGDGASSSYVGTVEDITAENAVMAELAAREHRQRVFFDHFPGLVAYVDRDLRYRYVSPGYEDWFGRPTAEIVGRDLREMLPPGAWAAAEPTLHRVLEEGVEITYRRDVRVHDGRTVHEQTTHVPDVDPSGVVRGFFVFSVDITQQLEAEASLALERERALVTLQSIADAVITVDWRGLVTYMNPVAQSLTGWDSTAAMGRPAREVFLLGDEASFEASENPVERCLAQASPVSMAGESILCSRDGDIRAVDVSVAPLTDQDESLVGAVIVFRDVSSARRLSQQLTWHASHDALTGIANRRQFEHSADLAIEAARSKGERHAVIYIDLDQFKIVNDTCGHAAGDRLLKEVTALLSAKVRGSDVLARLGGDEFGVLLRQCSVDKALELAERMRGELERYRFSFDGKHFAVGGSFGVVAIDENSESLAAVMRAADAACYLAKDAGRNRVHRYDASDRDVERRQDEMEWVGRVRRALEDNRLVLYGQAIVPLGSGASARRHFEVLLRMQDEAGKIVPPMAWIPAAERYGLMPQLDRWVIRNAFAQLGKCNVCDDSTALQSCSINLSGASLSDPAILDYVRVELGQAGVRPEQVCFEITETAVIANLALAQRFIGELRGLGVRFALDDFGAGMSSFGYLKALPVDYLKIDGSFVRRIAEDPVDYAIVEAVNNLGHVMGIRTVAEFVESEAVLARLRLLGVDYAQGYAIAPPSPLKYDACLSLCDPGRARAQDPAARSDSPVIAVHRTAH